MEGRLVAVKAQSPYVTFSYQSFCTRLLFSNHLSDYPHVIAANLGKFKQKKASFKGLGIFY